MSLRRAVFGLLLLAFACGTAMAAEPVKAPAADDAECVAIRHDLVTDSNDAYFEVDRSHGRLAACLLPLLEDASPYRGGCGPFMYSSTLVVDHVASRDGRISVPPCAGSPRCFRPVEVREVALYLLMNRLGPDWRAETCRIEHPVDVLSPAARDEIFAALLKAVVPAESPGPALFRRLTQTLASRGVGFWNEEPIEVTAELAAPVSEPPTRALVRVRAEDAPDVLPGAEYPLPVRLRAPHAVKAGTVHPGETVLFLPTRVLGWSADGHEVVLEIPGSGCLPALEDQITQVVEVTLEQAGGDRLAIVGCSGAGDLPRQPIRLEDVRKTRPTVADTAPEDVRVVVAGRARIGRETLTLVPVSVIEGDPRVACRTVTLPGVTEDPKVKGFIARLREEPDLGPGHAYIFEILGGTLVALSRDHGPFPFRCEEQPVEVSLCDLVREPEANDGRLVRVRAKYRENPEETMLVDDACGGRENAAWLGDNTYFRNDTPDDVLQAFDDAVAAHGAADVTVIGRFRGPRIVRVAPGTDPEVAARLRRTNSRWGHMNGFRVSLELQRMEIAAPPATPSAAP